ncbi:sarcosine oxidase subunit gamma [Pelagibius sp.]|uniref:sarcosine oxidase subunit gamma n=1 Tax=Pelagibius sp. TaxID=1931238 RepID=UPI00262D046C|nr:sarcosine oxidase subunit gamma family protein [Pelagibius sp.]
MVESYLRQSALAHLGLEARDQSGQEGAQVRLQEKVLPAAVNLRGDPSDEGFLAATHQALGVALPLEPNRVESSERIAVLWLGPNEWLAVSHDDEPTAESRLAERLREALADSHAAVTEVGESLACIHIAGPRAADVIAKGCPLDLHPGAFTAGHCAQSHIAKTAVTLHQVDDAGAAAGPGYDLYTRRSFSDYLWRWLSDAAREYLGA